LRAVVARLLRGAGDTSKEARDISRKSMTRTIMMTRTNMMKTIRRLRTIRIMKKRKMTIMMKTMTKKTSTRAASLIRDMRRKRRRNTNMAVGAVAAGKMKIMRIGAVIARGVPRVAVVHRAAGRPAAGRREAGHRAAREEDREAVLRGTGADLLQWIVTG
jgi:hypothetical protein